MDFRREPERLAPILGKTFIDTITDLRNPALKIGSDAWSKHETATKLGVAHPQACSALTKKCKDLGVASTKDLYERTSPYTFTNDEDRIGVTTMYVMFAAFRAKGLDPSTWYRRGDKKHPTDEKHAMRTFITLKAHEAKAAERERKEHKRRRRTNGNGGVHV